MNNTLTLDGKDPLVIAAREAEQRLFDFYSLQAKTHFIPLPGSDIKVRVSEIGSGKPVLIVPGNTGDVFPLVPLLAELKGRRIIAVNRPGGGLSEGMDHREVDLREFMVETLIHVLDYFSIDRIPIVAHSIGGHMSLWMAMDKPDRISAVTLLGVPGNIISTGPPFVLRLLSVPVLNRILLKLIIPRSTEQSLKGLGFMGHSAETLASLPNAMSECYYHFQHLPHYQVSILSLMEAGARRIIAEDLKQIKQPVMFLWGTNDPFGSVETGQEISNYLPSSEFNAIQDGGHLPWLDRPAQCGKLTQDFLSDY